MCNIGAHRSFLTRNQPRESSLVGTLYIKAKNKSRRRLWLTNRSLLLWFHFALNTKVCMHVRGIFGIALRKDARSCWAVPANDHICNSKAGASSAAPLLRRLRPFLSSLLDFSSQDNFPYKLLHLSLAMIGTRFRSSYGTSCHSHYSYASCCSLVPVLPSFHRLVSPTSSLRSNDKQFDLDLSDSQKRTRLAQAPTGFSIRNIHLSASQALNRHTRFASALPGWLPRSTGRRKGGKGVRKEGGEEGD